MLMHGLMGQKETRVDRKEVWRYTHDMRKKPNQCFTTFSHSMDSIYMDNS